MSLENFWPLTDQDHAESCLFTEAETAPDAVFLAVHQPMTLMRQKYQSDEGAIEQTEVQILEEFIQDNPSSGTVVMPITGDSAVGKSHMIRWIDAHLKIKGMAENRHIVRIPKSASMKTVLTMILKGLEGEEYEQLRDELRQAKLPQDASQARFDLRSKLSGALERFVENLQTKVQAGQANPEVGLRLSHARGLFLLLNENGVSQHFLRMAPNEAGRLGVFTRIVRPLLHDSHDVDHERDNRFQLEDFDFVTEGDVADLSREAQPYFRRLSREDERSKAVEILNELLDESLSGLIDFSGDSLPDLFKKVRQGLLAQGKELILLIEDFAMLGGIQQQLLDAVTDSALGPQGEQEYCVMRTAIAVTEGRLDEATVLTRAGASWKIRSHPFASDEMAVETFTNMVGAYLNAARHGVFSLRQQLEAGQGNEVNFANYLDEHGGELSEEERGRLDAFGYSSTGGYPLFPFNQNAVRQIMNRNLRKDGKYQFKPRAINKVIRDAVMNGRARWEQGEFPPAGFQYFTRNQLGSEVSLYLNQTPSPDRSAVLLGYWGGCPSSLAEAASLDELVYEAFGMQAVDWGGVAPAPVAPSPQVPGPPSTPSPEPQEPDAISEWKERMEAWRTNSRLGQTHANQLRKMIAEGVETMIDTDPLMLRKLDSDLQRIIYLPHAGTGNPDQSKFHLCAATEEDLTDSVRGPRFFLAMEAVVQFNERKKWNFEGAEKFYSRYVNFIEDMADQVEKQMRDVGPKTLPKEAITPLAHSLLIGARILNLDNASARSEDGMIKAMLDPGPTPDNTPQVQGSRWEDLKQATIRSREEMRQLLLDHVSARQGGAASEHAVDASTLIPVLESLKEQNWQLNNWGDDVWRKNLTNSKEHITKLRTQLSSIVKDEVKSAGVWATSVEEFLGDTFNLDVVIEALRKTIDGAMGCGAFRYHGSNDPKSLRQLISDVKKRPVKGCFDEAKKAIGEAVDFGTMLSAIGKLDTVTMVKTKELIDAVNNFLSETEQNATAKLGDAPNPEEVAEKLVRELESTHMNWNNIANQIKS